MSAYMNGGTPTQAKMTLPSAKAIKMENDTSSLGSDGSCEIYNGTLALPVQVIKSEPPLEINDSYEHDALSLVASGNNNDTRTNIEPSPESPKIRLKPTSKLMPCPNPTDPKRRFICPFQNCTKAYGKSSHLRSHLTWHTGIKPFVCKEPNCGRGFTRSDELNRHVRTHTGEKPFECVQCTKKFSRSDHLTKHLATHAKQMSGNNAKRTPVNTTGNEQSQPPQPEQQISQLDQVQLQPSLQQQRQQQIQQQNQQRRQQQHSRQLEYSLQQERLQRMAQQKRVEERLQQQQQHQIQSQSSERTDASDSNHLQFSDGMHFMAALISGNDPLGEGENESEAVGKLESTSLQIKEERAETIESDFQMMPQIAHPHHQHHQQQLQRQYQQNIHNAPEHLTESEDDIPPELIIPVSTMICPLSPETTRPHDPTDDQIMPEANAISLSKFESTILDPERPFRCVHCEKCFKRADDLNRHVRTHTGEKPYHCGECSRRFMRGDHLKKHMRTHTKAR